ncbi:hypothetical protein HZB02_07070 [Candidatus Woesearchaeota archaeon]|nr:hypothetical protein [Candidatus Woesearchaeota archaeon]
MLVSVITWITAGLALVYYIIAFAHFHGKERDGLLLLAPLLLLCSQLGFLLPFESKEIPYLIAIILAGCFLFIPWLRKHRLVMGFSDAAHRCCIVVHRPKQFWLTVLWFIGFWICFYLPLLLLNRYLRMQGISPSQTIDLLQATGALPAAQVQPTIILLILMLLVIVTWLFSYCFFQCKTWCTILDRKMVFAIWKKHALVTLLMTALFAIPLIAVFLIDFVLFYVQAPTIVLFIGIISFVFLVVIYLHLLYLAQTDALLHEQHSVKKSFATAWVIAYNTCWHGILFWILFLSVVQAISFLLAGLLLLHEVMANVVGIAVIILLWNAMKHAFVRWFQDLQVKDA